MPTNELRLPIEDFQERLTGASQFWTETFLSQICFGRNVLLLGPQGCGKTSAARLASEFLRVASFEYSAVTDDLFSSVGIPRPDRLAEGVFEIAITERSLLGCQEGDIIFIDEISRAPHASANLWLQALDRRIFSRIRNIHAGAIIAACNPSTSSFSGAIQLDGALLDRFHCVLTPPTEFSDEQIGDILTFFASRKKETTTIADGRPLQALMIEERERLLRDKALCEFLCRVYLPQVCRKIREAQQEQEADRRNSIESASTLSIRAMERCFDVVIDLLSIVELTHDEPLRDFCDAVEFAVQTALFYRSSLNEETFFHCLFPLSQDLRRFVSERLSRVDPVNRLAHGTTTERVTAFRSLDRSPLNDHDRHRLSLLLTKLVYEVCDEDSLENASALWWGLEETEFAHQRELLETQMLRFRLNHLLHDELPKNVGPAVLRNTLADPVMWSPGSPAFLGAKGNK